MTQACSVVIGSGFGRGVEALNAFSGGRGAFYTVLRSLPSAQRPGIMKIGDGGVVTYESAHSKGTMTFHESQDGKSWVWKWDGKTAEGQLVRNELTKPK